MHTKYGYIKLKKRYRTLASFIDNCKVHFSKPYFSKPFKCAITNEFCWSGWTTDLNSSSYVKDFPEGKVKERIKQLISDSIRNDLSETFENRHYKWIGELNVEFIRKEYSGDFNLYLTKPSVSEIKFSGLDRAIFWFYKPKIKKFEHSVSFNSKSAFSGKTLRTCWDDNLFVSEVWKDIVCTFDIKYKSSGYFYRNISEEYQKTGENSEEFIKEYYFDLIVI